MNALKYALLEAVRIIETTSKPFALVGGIAVSTRAEPRFTRDVDLAIAVSDDSEAELLVYEFVQQGYVVATSVEHTAMRRLSTVRLQPAKEKRGVLIDCLFASSGIEHEITHAAERLEVFPDFSLPVAQTGHLIAMKILACDERTRPQDAMDLNALFHIAMEDDLKLAKHSLQLIELRGYARKRDLLHLFDLFYQRSRNL